MKNHITPNYRLEELFNQLRCVCVWGGGSCLHERSLRNWMTQKYSLTKVLKFQNVSGANSLPEWKCKTCQGQSLECLLGSLVEFLRWFFELLLWSRVLVTAGLGKPQSTFTFHGPRSMNLWILNRRITSKTPTSHERWNQHQCFMNLITYNK